MLFMTSTDAVAVAFSGPAVFCIAELTPDNAFDVA
jgi:hypothetical protein